MKFLKKFATRAEYEAYMVGNENYPFVVYIADEKKVEYHPLLDFSSMPFYVKALENTTVSFTTNTIQYSLDNETWVDLPANTTAPTISAGGKMYFRAEGLSPTSSAGIGTFNIAGRCNLGGNIMSLLYGDDFVDKVSIGKEYLFYKLFYQQTSIVHAGNLVLPATTLQPNCYKNMFSGCTSLTNAPKILPATTLKDSSYMYMFRNCASLVNAPELRVLTLAQSCCYGMFWGCTSLVNTPELHATTLQSDCYQNMFRGCSSLVNAPELPALILAKNCYQSMFEDCSSIVNAPALPATTLKESCYGSMFSGCSSLVNAPELPALTLVTSCYNNMFWGCTNLQYIKAMFTTTPTVYNAGGWVTNVKPVGTFVKNAAATWDVTGGNGIPSGWTIETATE